MQHSDSKGDRKRRWREVEKQEWHRYHEAKGKYLRDDEIGPDYTKTLYRSWERGVDTTVFRHDKSKERK